MALLITSYIFSIGTYNPHEGLSSEDECLACPPGLYCDQSGLSAPAGNCSAGFLCLGNATVAAPNDGVNGPCPHGYYCEEGKKNVVLAIFPFIQINKYVNKEKNMAYRKKHINKNEKQKTQKKNIAL